MMTDNVDALIFDMDGTLWNAMKTYAEVWNIAFREQGVNVVIDEDTLESGMGHTIDDILDMLEHEHGFHLNRRPFLKRVDEIEDELLQKMGGIPYPGMQQGIAHLSQKYPLFLLSNCSAGALPNFMRHTGIGCYITDYLSYGMRQYAKSDNLAYLAAKHHLANAVYVGDTQSDCNHAHRAGMPFVYASYGFGDCTGYDLRINQFADLEKYFL